MFCAHTCFIVKEGFWCFFSFYIFCMCTVRAIDGSQLQITCTHTLNDLIPERIPKITCKKAVDEWLETIMKGKT